MIDLVAELCFSYVSCSRLFFCFLKDAAEAFLHLLCLLREEFGGCYAPKMSSLADIFASNNRILTPIQRDCQSEQERWQQLFLGPFDGILGSRLTCQSCSSLVQGSFLNAL